MLTTDLPGIDAADCDSTECHECFPIDEFEFEIVTSYCDRWEPADRSVTAILVLAALAWYPLVRWVLVPISTFLFGDW